MKIPTRIMDPGGGTEFRLIKIGQGLFRPYPTFSESELAVIEYSMDSLYEYFVWRDRDQALVPILNYLPGKHLGWGYLGNPVEWDFYQWINSFTRMKLQARRRVQRFGYE